MKYFIVFLNIFCAIQLSAQKHDYVWMWGGYRSDSTDYNIYGNFLDFNNGNRNISTEVIKYDIDQVNNSISDKNGNLLFYFNGCFIVGADHQLIENGDSINYSSWWSSISNCQNGYTGPQNTLILPDPAYENGYYIIHKTVDWVQFPEKKTISTLGLKTTYVDMNMNGGKGKVIFKNKVVFEDTLMWGYLHAVKHANGHDWWIVDLKESPDGGLPANSYFVFHLNQGGISFHRKQNFGNYFTDNSSSCGSAKFSPDGRQWAYYCKRDGFKLLDFDRTSGEFTNYRDFIIPHMNSKGGLEWSANGRFIYLSTLDSLFQYDTWSSDFTSSELLVDVWDKTNDPFKTVFAHMERGPDCKIYMSSLSSTKSIHVINNPDEPAPFCNFVQHDLKLFSTTGTVSMPTFPNYRLDSGPVCDPTITTSSKDITDTPHISLNVFPNPTSGAFYIESAYQYRNAEIRIVDMQGRRRWQGPHERTLSLHSDMLESGVYIIELLHENRVLAKHKLVVVR